MFTIEQIKEAHSRVRSGADFPAYIRELKSLGVQSYRFSVANGSTTYRGVGGQEVESGPRYEKKEIKRVFQQEEFADSLKHHQAGGSSFPEFCEQCMHCGVDSWRIDLAGMTCIYMDAGGRDVWMETIPE